MIERAEEVVDLTIRMIRKEMCASPLPRCSPPDTRARKVLVTSYKFTFSATVCLFWLWSLWANSKPVMAKFDCRMIEVLPTSTQPMRGFADRMMAMEAHSELSGLSEIKSHIPGDPEILSVSCIHGFMAADVECMGSAMLVITDNQPEKGAGLAQKLGMELFELRGTTRPEYLHPQAGIDRAVAADKTPKPGFKGNKMPAVIADVWVSHVCNVIGRAATFACRAVNGHIER